MMVACAGGDLPALGPRRDTHCCGRAKGDRAERWPRQAGGRSAGVVPELPGKGGADRSVTTDVLAGLDGRTDRRRKVRSFVTSRSLNPLGSQ